MGQSLLIGLLLFLSRSDAAEWDDFWFLIECLLDFGFTVPLLLPPPDIGVVALIANVDCEDEL